MARKERRGQRRIGNRSPSPPNTGNRQVTPKNVGQSDLETSSRFAILDGLDGNECGHHHEGRGSSMANQIVDVALPRI